MDENKVRNPKILIVDDETGLRDLLREEFELLGWKVFEAPGGNLAIELLKKNSVEIVLSDIRMSQGDGVQLLDYIQKNISPPPSVFMVTGFADIPNHQLVSMGAIAVINKPYDLDEVIGTITHFYKNRFILPAS